MKGAKRELGEPSLKLRSITKRSRSSTKHSRDGEAIDAEASFEHYCQPTELYNCLMLRAKENASFLNRCLNYRIKARNKRINLGVEFHHVYTLEETPNAANLSAQDEKDNCCTLRPIDIPIVQIKMTVSVSLRMNETEKYAVPLYVCLGRQFQNNNDEECADADYQLSGMFRFQNSSEIDGDTVNAMFNLPEINKFTEEAKSGSLYILVFTTVKDKNSSCEANADLVPSDKCEIYFN
ncbi:hypothetical protein Lal_00022300 [Lupinus albus]|nr:hypothetical protein Lal_00022300 [Lupinus albus]